MRGTRWIAALALALAVAAGCDDGKSKGSGDGGGSNGGTTGTPNGNANDGKTGDGSTAAGQGSVKGVVYGINFGQAAPLADVSVTGPGGKVVTSDDQGVFTLADIGANADLVLVAELDGFSQGFRNVEVVKDQTSYVEIFLKKVTIKGSFDADEGGRVKDSVTGAGAKFAGGTLVNKKSGAKASGQVTAELTTIDPSNPQELKTFPGHFQAKNKNGAEGLLETYAPMEVRVKSKDGEDLSIKENAQAEIEFPFPANVKDAPDKIDLWSLDEATGKWKHEGTAEKAQDEAGKDVYKAKIGHLSWWNCDAFIDAITCVRGCVKDGSKAVAGALVQFLGIGWSFRENDFTGADGCFYANLKQDSQVAILASSGAGVSDIKQATTDKTSKKWEDGQSACQDLGDFALRKRDSTDPCPSGYANCGFGPQVYCHDLLNDSEQCSSTGKCEDAVNCYGQVVGGPAGFVCRQGECVCPPNKTLCNGSCVDLNDRSSCGKNCDTRAYCQQTENCVDGACVEVMCPQGQTLCSSRSGNPVCVDLNTSAEHCGSCRVTCGSRGNSSYNDGSFACVGGQCTCTNAAGTKCGPTDSSYVCANTQNDPDNCGACAQTPQAPQQDASKICGAAQECKGGACTDLACPNGQTACNHKCVDTNADDDNCGECASACYTNQTCVGGACTCATGFADCNDQGYCLSLEQNDFACGTCGTVCADDQICDAGKCVKLTCPAPYSVCNHWCLNTNTDRYNCGGCSTEQQQFYCPGDLQCISGECGCPQGLTACDGYCVDTNTATGHCGACGSACPGTCSGGSCICPTGDTLCCPGPSAYCAATCDTPC